MVMVPEEVYIPIYSGYILFTLINAYGEVRYLKNIDDFSYFFEDNNSFPSLEGTITISGASSELESKNAGLVLRLDILSTDRKIVDTITFKNFRIKSHSLSFSGSFLQRTYTWRAQLDL